MSVVKHSSSYKINIKNDETQGAGLRLWLAGGGDGFSVPIAELGGGRGNEELEAAESHSEDSDSSGNQCSSSTESSKLLASLYSSSSFISSSASWKKKIGGTNEHRYHYLFERLAEHFSHFFPRNFPCLHVALLERLQGGRCGSSSPSNYPGLNLAAGCRGDCTLPVSTN